MLTVSEQLEENGSGTLEYRFYHKSNDIYNMVTFRTTSVCQLHQSVGHFCLTPSYTTYHSVPENNIAWYFRLQARANRMTGEISDVMKVVQ